MLACVGGAWTGGVAADEPPPINFQKMTPEQRYYWLDGAIMTAIHLASMGGRNVGECATNWYLDDIKGKQRMVEQKLAQYPSIKSPTTIIIGLMSKACGPLVPE